MLRWRSVASVRLLLLLFLAISAIPHIARAQDEFLVNDDRVDRNQWAPRAARGVNGTILFVWMDGRSGTGSLIDYDIYLMTLRDPLGLGSSVNRRVNDDPPGPVQGFPDIAASPSKKFLCVWEDGRAGNRDIYAGAFDSLGTSIAPSLRVNDDVGTSEQVLPRVVGFGADDFLVVWGDGREGQGEVYGSFRTATGAPLGANRRISVDPVPGGSFQGEPGAASGPGGRTLIVWLDGREGGTVFGAASDVYAQWLDAAGNPLSGNFKVNGTTAAGHCASPSVAADPTQGFVVAWIDRRDAPGDPGDVYVQRFDPSGAMVGPNVRVNDDPLGRDQRKAQVADGPGGAVVIWEDLRGNLGIDSNVMASIVPYDGGLPGANFRVNEEVSGRQGTPSAIWDGREAFLGVWEDGRRGSPDIFASAFFPDGRLRGSDTQLNDDAAPFNQNRIRLGHGPGLFIATWIDGRNQSSQELYGQWITAAGAREGVNHFLWRDDLIERPMASASAVTRLGQGLVVAQISRFSDAGDIRGFFYAAAGTAPTTSSWIGDVLPSAQASPAAAGSDSEFAVVWIDGRDGAPRIYGQRLQADGTRIGVNHPVLQSDPVDPVRALDITDDPAGGYWLCYAEGAAVDQRMWLLHLDEAMAPLGEPIPVAPGFPGGRDTPGVGISNDGHMEVIWLGTGADGYGHAYHESFGPGLSSLAVGALEAEAGRPAAAPSLALSGSESIVTWEERGTQGDWSIWLQRFERGVAFAAPIRVDQDLSASDQFDPCAGIDAAGHAVVLWTDLRSTTSGSDILGRAFAFAPTLADDPPPIPAPEPPPAPRVARIGPARPNPFSSVTAAPIELRGIASSRALVRVWNVRGERIATLADGAPPGERYLVRWDGRDDRGRPAASGIYWITVEAGGERHATRVVHIR